MVLSTILGVFDVIAARRHRSESYSCHDDDDDDDVGRDEMGKLRKEVHSFRRSCAESIEPASTANFSKNIRLIISFIVAGQRCRQTD